jgi:anti-sigma regulatory factor (Ser/Thr protein kinase)
MISQQRDAAETLQHGLLPDRLPTVVGVELAARYRPAGRGAEVGGDWYDVISLPGGQVGLVMGDVVGHDFRAASMMGQFRNALRAYAAEGLPPADVLGRLNTFAHQQDLGEMATVVYAVLDPVAGTFSVSSAGHQPPLICTGRKAWFLSVPTRPPIGAVRETRFGEVTRTLEPDDVVLLYTDGLVERKWESIDDGLERLRGSARASGDLDELCEVILSTLLEDDPHDDVALLAVAAASTLGDRFEMDFPAEAPSLLKLRRALTRWLNEVGATAEESYEILVSVSEAATNAVEHAYGPGPATFHVGCRFEDSTVRVGVRDWGQWREPRGLDRGRGQILMDGLMDSVRRTSADGGTEVVLCRRLREERGDKCRKPELEVHG